MVRKFSQSQSQELHEIDLEIWKTKFGFQLSQFQPNSHAEKKVKASFLNVLCSGKLISRKIWMAAPAHSVVISKIHSHAFLAKNSWKQCFY